MFHPRLRGHPVRLRTRRSRAPLLLFFICLSAMSRTTANAQTIRPDFYVTNGPVHALTLSGGTLYVGGAFTQVGPATGPGIPLGSSDGLPIAGFPKVAGGLRPRVNVAVPDGSGGWYIGGLFHSVGGLPRSNI